MHHHVASEATSVRAIGRRIVRRLRDEWSRHLPSDIEEDCLQEVAIVLWQIRDRLSRLPEEKRHAYARVCVRRAVWSTIRREVHLQSCQLPLEEREWILPAEGMQGSGSHSGSTLADRLRFQHPELAEALDRLRPSDRALLEQYYLKEVPDREAAAALGTTEAAITKRRARLILGLRKALRSSGDCGFARDLANSCQL